MFGSLSLHHYSQNKFFEQNSMKDFDAKSIVRELPDKPGVYQFLDSEGTIIYIGKAKSIKKRVSSYFNKQQFESAKLKVLVKKIRKINHFVVNTEADAFLLENNLIKKHQPKYNINLKDDKTFPWICIKSEPFPRVFSTRKLINDGSKYYGPFTSAGTVRTLLHLIRELYPLRTCKLNLTSENIEKGKFKVCLEYHLGNCLGPCEGFQSEQHYEESIKQIHNILKGNLGDVIRYMKEKMKEHATHYQFEEAGSMKTKIEALENFQMKSTVVNPSIHDVEVYSIKSEDTFAVVNFLKINNGAIVQAHNVEVSKKLDETPEELLAFSVFDLRERMHSESPEVILPMRLEGLPGSVKQTIPRIGDKKKLLELSSRNAMFFFLERKKQKTNASPLKSRERILKTLKDDLRMNRLPYHIECFDNSNIQGSDPVAACVVFRDLKPSKKDYRHYNIKSVTGPDDFASMYEVVKRRYVRLSDENQKLPELIVIDGGKGQLNAAVKALRDLNLFDQIRIIGIAKRLEEIYFPGDPVPLYIDKNSESLKVIQQLRNEAHRFGISFHRQKRSISMIKSSLEEIEGIGASTVEKLIKSFGSVDKIKQLDYNDLEKIVGPSKAKKVFEAFNETE